MGICKHKLYFPWPHSGQLLRKPTSECGRIPEASQTYLLWLVPNQSQHHPPCAMSLTASRTTLEVVALG